MSLKILVTGSAGFVGYHLANKLLNLGHRVLGLDSISDYYDVKLKLRRNANLLQSQGYTFEKCDITNFETTLNHIDKFNPDIIIHLAAQAGVRYSLENPRSYFDTNLAGTFNIMEICRLVPPRHLLMASTSSVYGANKVLPFDENQKCDHQISLYAATKKAAENLMHSFSHSYDIPITMFRFFTVYGPWGRPDMALFKFTKNILENKRIDVYNHGIMKRDFTYVDDIVMAITGLMEAIPGNVKVSDIDSLSPVAKFRVVNIGNETSIELMDYIGELEKILGMKAKINFLPMQQGDVEETLASTELLKSLTGFRPQTKISVGIKSFVDWYRSYYDL